MSSPAGPDDARETRELSPRTERIIVVAMVILYVLLALGFSTGPIFEGHDEIAHYQYIRVLLETRALPDLRDYPPGEYHQAPLYYLINAPLAALIDDPDREDIATRRNPTYGYVPGVPGNDNKNIRVHTTAEAFPYSESGTARATHMLRIISVALGTGTVLSSYAIFRLLWPQRPDRRLAALGFVAFLPNFLYMSGTVNNDNLLFFLATFSLYLLLRQERVGPTRRSALLLGLALGAALLTKASAAFLVFPVGVAILLDRRTWRYVPLMAIVVFAVAGWWYVRNIIIFGDPTLTQTLWREVNPEFAIAGGKLALGIGLQRIPWAYQTFWARFASGGQVPVNPQMYVFFNALTLVTLGGAGVWLARTVWRQRQIGLSKASIRSPLVIGLFALAWVAALIFFASSDWFGNQGRYLLPGVAAWGALLALGLDTWTPQKAKLPVALGGVLLMATIAAISLFAFFLPAYRVRPVPATIENRLAYRYGDAAELIGIEPQVTVVRPGETTKITLYWRAIEPTDESLWAYLNSVDSNVVRRSSLPATGNLLSTHWEPGQKWREEYVVQIAPDAETQVAYDLVAGLFEPDSDENLPVSDVDGNEAFPVVGQIVIQSTAQPFEPAYRFGDTIGLAEPVVTLESGELQVCLNWVSLTETAIDYHVFIHVVDADGDMLTQRDFQPKEGLYPTYAWGKGEAISECAMLDASAVPADDWQVNVGLYDFATGQRLPIRDAADVLLADNMLTVQQ